MKSANNINRNNMKSANTINNMKSTNKTYIKTE